LTFPQKSEVTALSQAFAIAIPHEQALDAKDEVGFFQAVKARLSKFDSTDESSSSNEDLEITIRQVIDQALVSERVIDVFDAAGIKKPDISILSDEFLAELKGYEHKNIALEVLKKLLNDELKVRAKKNLVQSKTLMEMLENATIDWTIKESVRAKLKVIVKRILRQYGYPPDMQLLATETVLKQAEMIAKELMG
jgi:type I restriction enzyme, R subunit